MIFVTVGTQFPFDRLTGTVDAWAARANRRDVFAQIGGSSQSLTTIEHEPFIDAARCHKLLSESDLVVAHAGMGTVLTCLAHGTPVIVMARRAELGEHRNDHQVATVEWMKELSGVTVVDTPDALTAALDAFETAGHEGKDVSASADPELLATVRDFIASAPAARRSWRSSLWDAIRGRRGQPVDLEGHVGVASGEPAVSAAAPTLPRQGDEGTEQGSDTDPQQRPATAAASPEPRRMISAASF